MLEMAKLVGGPGNSADEERQIKMTSQHHLQLLEILNRNSFSETGGEITILIFMPKYCIVL